MSRPMFRYSLVTSNLKDDEKYDGKEIRCLQFLLASYLLKPDQTGELTEDTTKGRPILFGS